ncbi:PIN domain-containing protein [Actinophytocola sp.]|uniref:PIN domain-containing protein n=1 Tax=Actinophytocola sp. TaxID=1872138 RepID=UPI00389A3149
MIVLDTNQLRAVGCEQNTKLTLLRGVARFTGHPLAIPEIVEQEYLGWYRRSVDEALGTVTQADHITDRMRDKLLGLVPWWVGRPQFARGEPGENLPILTEAVKRRQQLLHNIFTILPTPPGAADEGNKREVERRPPAVVSGDSGKGGRDTVVWLTTLAEAQRCRPSNLYFVAKDRGFGSKHLLPELQAEAPSNLVYLDSVDRLLNRLSCPADPPLPPDELINTDLVQQAVRNCVSSGNFKIDLHAWPQELGSAPIDLDHELFPQPRKDETLACRLGEDVLVATNRVWGVRWRYLEVPRGTSDNGPGAEKTLDVSVRLALLAVFEDDELVRASVFSRGGLRGHDTVDDER